MYAFLNNLIDVSFKGFSSLILPGFGQLQNGEWVKSLLLAILFCFLTLCINTLVALFASAESFQLLFFSSIGGLFAVWLYAILDALVQGWRRKNLQRKRWQTLPVYCLFLVTSYSMWFGLLDGLVYQGYMRAHFIDRFRIPSQSMLPTLMNGDLIFADRRINCQGCKHTIDHGDIVLFKNPKKTDMILIKRVIGISGDTILIDGVDIFRNGKKLTINERVLDDGRIETTEQGLHGTYITQWQHRSTTQKKYIIPVGSIFVMGDNRNKSKDSRFIGSIPIEHVFATPLQIFLSFDRDFNIRNDRIGMPIL